MRLTGAEIEQAFTEAALEMRGGPFDWERVAERLNARLAALLVGRGDHQPRAMLGGKHRGAGFGEDRPGAARRREPIE